MQAHKVGLDLSRLDSPSSAAARSASDSCPPPPKQPRINTALHTQAREAYRKLINTAYHLALGGLPLTAFKAFVQCQKDNGVKLIHGTDSSNTAKTMIHEIALAIQQKIKVVLNSATAISILSDGSQARKSGTEKEFILARTVHLHVGLPVYYIVGNFKNKKNLTRCTLLWGCHSRKY